MPEMKLACFVTPHGFGHAARACALVQAIADLCPEASFEIFTAVPDWFFHQSLTCPLGYHYLQTDIGVVQNGPLVADLPATVDRLGRFLPFDPALVDALALRLTHLRCRAVISDIAPLGIAVARHAGISSILVENFTWDWIYRAYADRHPGLGPHIDYLQTVFARADLHIQTEPICGSKTGTLQVGPLGRRARQNRAAVRAALCVAEDAKLVTVSMGGVPGPELIPAATCLPAGVTIALAAGQGAACLPGVIRLAPDAGFYHPDLVGAADATIGKIGYSTLAEVLLAGIPYGFVARADCPEAPILAAYACRHLSCLRIDPAELANGRWIDRLASLLALPRQTRPPVNAAGQAAGAILAFLESYRQK